MDGEAHLRCAMTASPTSSAFAISRLGATLTSTQSLSPLLASLTPIHISQIANDGGYRWPVRFMGWPLPLTGGREDVSRWTNNEAWRASPDCGAAPAQRSHCPLYGGSKRLASTEASAADELTGRRRGTLRL
jgi:hypothetical protein